MNQTFSVISSSAFLIKVIASLFIPIRFEIEDIDYIGIKLLPLPSELPVSYRTGINKDAITLIRKALDELPEKVSFKQ